MFSLSICPHSMATPAFLKQVIAIKNVAWSHSEESQWAWMQNNLNPEDLHCLLLEDEHPIGYVNLVNEQLIDGNENSIWIWGIGNVCVAIKGKGYGAELMEKTNEFITITKRVGLLLCHERVRNFYEKCGWVVNKEVIRPENGILAMTYNFDNTIKYTYKGRLF